MNIFHLSDCPVTSAKAMTNKHVVKMILESAQMLSTAHLVVDGTPYKAKTKTGRNCTRYSHPLEHILYKATHINHPSSVWCRKTKQNYDWLYAHFIALCNEYTARYGKIHLTEQKLSKLLKTAPIGASDTYSTRFALAMPEQYKQNDPVQSYRSYYEAEKLKLDVDIARYCDILSIQLEKENKIV